MSNRLTDDSLRQIIKENSSFTTVRELAEDLLATRSSLAKMTRLARNYASAAYEGDEEASDRVDAAIKAALSPPAPRERPEHGTEEQDDGK